MMSVEMQRDSSDKPQRSVEEAVALLNAIPSEALWKAAQARIQAKTGAPWPPPPKPKLTLIRGGLE